jgi:hypothetical protein
MVPFDAKAAKVWGEYVSRPALKQKPRSYSTRNLRALPGRLPLLPRVINTKN